MLRVCPRILFEEVLVGHGIWPGEDYRGGKTGPQSGRRSRQRSRRLLHDLHIGGQPRGDCNASSL